MIQTLSVSSQPDPSLSVHHGSVLLMVALGVLVVAGGALTVAWGGRPYRTWRPGQPHTDQVGDDVAPDLDEIPSARDAALRYLRGVALALVGGFWAGALVTGPAVRLIMRLLAATAGTDAQGRLTEAEEVVGDIDLEGTVGLYVFGGILPGLLSGVIYVIVRRWLPRGRLGGVAFGVLHLVVAATRIDPLRADNPDFDLVGPGWLSVLTFGLASIVHGMAVVALVNRFSLAFPPVMSDRAARARALAPLALPVLLVIANIFLVIPIVIGLALTVAVLAVDRATGVGRSRAFGLAGRVAIIVVFLASAPGAIGGLVDIVTRG